MPDKVIVAMGVVLTIIVLFLDDFEKDSSGLLLLIIINFITIIIVYSQTKNKQKVCSYIIWGLITINILLYINTGSMGNGMYTISFLKDTTDVIQAIILFSPFLFLIPLGIYLLFLRSLINLFCNDTTFSQTTPQ